MEKGLNQKVVAEAAGVTNAAVSKWESNGGQSISAIVALKLSELLNVNPFWLIFGKGHPNDKIEMPEVSKNTQALAVRIEQLPDPVRDALGRFLLTL